MKAKADDEASAAEEARHAAEAAIQKARRAHKAKLPTHKVSKLPPSLLTSLPVQQSEAEQRLSVAISDRDSANRACDIESIFLSQQKVDDGKVRWVNIE